MLRCVFEISFWFSVLVTNAPLCITLQVMLWLALKTAKCFGFSLMPMLTWMRQTGANFCLKFWNDVVLRCGFAIRFWICVLVTDTPLFMKLLLNVAQKRANCWLMPKLTWMRQTGVHWCFAFVNDFAFFLFFWKSLMNFCSSNQRTALHEAACYGRTKACRQLIDAKADVNATDGCALMFWNVFMTLCCIVFLKLASDFLF